MDQERDERPRQAGALRRRDGNREAWCDELQLHAKDCCPGAHRERLITLSAPERKLEVRER